MAAEASSRNTKGTIFRVRAAMHSETSSGWIWCKLGDKAKPRSLVKIRNEETHKSTVCEYREIDEYFLQTYNKNKAEGVKLLYGKDNPIVISYWYRSILGIEELGSLVNLSITPVRTFRGFLRAASEHPDVMVRLAMFLALCGLWLGLLSVILSIVSVASGYARLAVMLIGAGVLMAAAIILAFAVKRLKHIA